ncbi:hypothetical protein RZO50_00260 [Microbacterium sp. SSW1-59]|uniref:hypothetical protein n=1 Tax=Microbacterium xanthum TaxID=3079794 RepID=UPI002AD507B1|nr:hypothetical protein [Microbacterium sp. SSW1-59]MDZ8199934.1 hypothetical protein [Microbacterium sp. SSW1-59]
MAETDPTRVRAQRSLQEGGRRRWLIPGAIFAAICIALFIGMLQLQTLVPTIGLVLTASLFAAMVVVAVTVGRARTRNRAMAWLMGTMAVSALVCAALVMAGEWSAMV